MTGSLIARASAILLTAGGVALLFAPEEIVALLAGSDELPMTALLGQLLAAAWLGLAALNWLTRGSVLGGIYGRPIVLANASLYFISAMVLLDAPKGAAVWIGFVLAAAMAAAYGALLFRGPFTGQPK